MVQETGIDIPALIIQFPESNCPGQQQKTKQADLISPSKPILKNQVKFMLKISSSDILKITANAIYIILAALYAVEILVPTASLSPDLSNDYTIFDKHFMPKGYNRLEKKDQKIENQYNKR
ncbi:MAG: hypothetical protein EZS28_025808 [Streblomastix strix]|uniref:Uncharacterized protein n=1 Tax=Streblomastix strix TaxID=222440 RepID=A0A5J4V874_9EUKA|nr:MAG: hypothetical protein EZS28_025808 [Streblomastix strix]